MDISVATLLGLVGTTVGGGLLVSLVAQAIKKTAGLKSGAVIHTAVVALASAGAAAQYVIQIHSKIPPVVLGISGPAIYGISQAVYKYVSYGSAFAAKVSAYNAGTTGPQVVATPAITSTTITTGAPNTATVSGAKPPTEASF